MKENNAEKIRGLLDETKMCVELWQIRHEYNKDCECNKCRAITRINKLLSILPPPCGKCGGSGKVPNPTYGLLTKTKTDIIREVPCPACSPAGEIEEFVERATKKWSKKFELSDATLNDCLCDLLMACTHLAAQATELRLFRRNFCEAHQPLPEDTYEGCYCCDAVAQAKQIKQLEKENRWIPVSERLPKQCKPYTVSQDVLMVCAGRVYKGTYDYGKGEGWTIYSSYQRSEEYQAKVTHWKPIFLPKKT